MAITIDAIATALPAGRRKFTKPSVTSEGVGTRHSLWAVSGGNPAAGATPPVFTAGAGYTPTGATLGSVERLVNPGGANNRYLAQMLMSGTVAGTLVLYDRLWACSGFDTTSVALQSITTPGALPSGRDPFTGKDVEMWLEVYTAPGATGATWTLGYQDQDNNAATATYTHPANAETVGQLVRVPLAAGDSGVRQATSFQASVSSGTAGNIGATLLREIGRVPLAQANVAGVMNWIDLGLPEIFDDACLAAYVECTTTTTGFIDGTLAVIELAP